MKVFYAFLIIFTAVFMWLLPITTAVYDFRTDLREDAFTSPTVAGVTTANVTLTKPIYDDDTNTIDILSALATDTPAYASYNATSRQLGISGLTANTTRTLTVTYDIDALVGNDSINTLMDYTPYFWYLCVICFAPLGLLALYMGRA